MRANNTKRNKTIYKLWKTRNSVAEIAEDYTMSVSNVQHLCRKIDLILSSGKNPKYSEYWPLLK